ncbi:MAG: DUF2007 domain-containing protein [Sinomicrobium sp.]|nr:DUF2007 domain-containing protein [Sinomicrobium sp.]
MKDFTVVATFTYPYEYAVLRLLLEREAIPHVFENETMVSVSPFYSHALGGIRLKVHKKDLEAVKAIMDRLNAPDLRIV